MILLSIQARSDGTGATMNPDGYGKYVTRDDAIEHAAEQVRVAIEARDKRIAELEARSPSCFVGKYPGRRP